MKTDHLFLITLKYIKPHFAIDQFFPKHEAFLNEFIEKGHFICSGRKVLKTGEFILCKAPNRRTVQQIVAQDPFDQFQLAVFDIEEYDLITADDIFKQERNEL